MGPEDLAHVLQPLKRPSPPDLLIGLDTADDGAVYRLGSDTALIQTVDFFPPIVDDPYTFGAVAAANALSDIYAMGGEPFLALAIAGFPRELPHEIIRQIFRGGADKAGEAGVIVAGGHTVVDEEPKYGLVVTGRAHPDSLLRKDGARPGDVLYLTKPVGTGVITTAHKNDAVQAAHLDAAVAWMLRLNGAAARLLRTLPVQAATDITGFGLLGHAHEMAAAAGVRFEVVAADIPLLAGAYDYAAADFLPGGQERNRDYLIAPADGGARVTVDADVDPLLAELLFDPQTSGGLLFAAPAAATERVEAAFAAADHPLWRIGHVQPGANVHVS
jgi:selenide,water dikinase